MELLKFTPTVLILTLFTNVDSIYNDDFNYEHASQQQKHFSIDKKSYIEDDFDFISPKNILEKEFSLMVSKIVDSKEPDNISQNKALCNFEKNEVRDFLIRFGQPGLRSEFGEEDVIHRRSQSADVASKATTNNEQSVSLNETKTSNPGEMSVNPIISSKRGFEQQNPGGEILIHRPAPIIVNRPPTKVVVSHPPLIVKPAPVIFHRPPAVIYRPIVVKPRPEQITMQPVYIKVIKTNPEKVFIQEPAPCDQSKRQNIFSPEHCYKGQCA